MKKVDAFLQVIWRLAMGLFLLSPVFLIDSEMGLAEPGLSPAPSWPGDVRLSTAAGDQREIFMLPTKSGGAIVVWQNSASGNVFAQKIDRKGRPRWNKEGVPAAAAPWYQFAPKAAGDGADGIIMTWVDGRNGFCDPGFQGQCVIYAQRIDANGQTLWGDTGVPICTAEGNRGVGGRHTGIVADGNGGAIVVWDDGRPPSCCRIFAQRVNAQGQVQWEEDGIPISPEPTYLIGPMSGSTFAVSDEEGGVLIMWLDYQNPTITPYLKMQRVNSDGQSLWEQNGITVGSPGYVNYSLSSDGFRGALAAWAEYASQDANIYLQRIGPAGQKLWNADGVQVTAEPHYQWFPQVAPDGYGGALVVWGDERHHSAEDIGGCDMSYGNCDVFAQRIDYKGIALWQPDGIPISTAPGNQFMPQIVADGSHGAIVAWQDCREVYDDPPCDSNLQCPCLLQMDLYAQRVDENGQILWQTDGSPLSTSDGNQGIGPGTPAFAEFSIINNEPGGVVAGWPDGRNFLCGYPLSPSSCELYAQMLTDFVSPSNPMPGMQLLLLDD